MKFTAVLAIFAIANVEAISFKTAQAQEPAPPLSSIGMSLIKTIGSGLMAAGAQAQDNMTNETTTPYKVQYPAHK